MNAVEVQKGYWVFSEISRRCPYDFDMKFSKSACTVYIAVEVSESSGIICQVGTMCGMELLWPQSNALLVVARIDKRAKAEACMS